MLKSLSRNGQNSPTLFRAKWASLFCYGPLLLCAALSPSVAEARNDTDPPDIIEVTGSAAITSDYRFRGISLSDGDPALQGGIEAAHESGLYVGGWTSSIDDSGDFGDAELDLYAGWRGSLSSAIDIDAGVVYYSYPSKKSGVVANYWEPYMALSGSLGPAELTVGATYAWKQEALGDDDNRYFYSDLTVGVPATPVTVKGHIGYTDGALSPGLLTGSGKRTGVDYSIGASMAVFGDFELEAAYVGVDAATIADFSKDSLVLTLSLSF